MISKNVIKFSFLLFGLLSVCSAVAQTRWARQMGSGGLGTIGNLALDASGRTYMVGSATGPITFGGTALGSTGSTTGFVAKWDAQGNMQWARQVVGDVKLIDVAGDADGNAYALGQFSGRINLGGQMLASQGTTDMVLLKYDAQGQVLWSRQGGSQKGSGLTGTALALDKQGNVYLTGTLNGTADGGSGVLTGESTANVYVASYTAQGTQRWAQQAGGRNSLSGGAALGVDAVGNAYISGGISGTAIIGASTISTPGSFLLAKCDAAGAFSWAVAYGSSSYGGPGAPSGAARLDMAVDEQGNTAMTGMVNENIPAVFGAVTLKSTGGHDGYVVKFDAAGKLLWTDQVAGTDTDYGTSVAFDKLGNVYTTGVFASLPTRWGGTTSLARVGGKNAYIVKYDPQGKILAARREGACGGTYSQHIAVNASQEVCIAGSFDGFASFVATVFESTGPAGNLFLAKVGDLSTPSTPDGFSCSSFAAPSPAPIPTPAPTPVPALLELIVPNIITPNGDGLNDKFKVPGLADNRWSLTVYSRWGQRVYQSAAYQEDWDAAGLAAGTYYYLLRHATGREYKGWVAVVR